MRADIELSLAAARAVHLEAQGLRTPLRRRARKSDVLEVIEQMQLLQIDTIHVVARSPYLVLHSRLGDYAPDWLDELLADARVFEIWAHEACVASIADWPLLHAQMCAKEHHWARRNARRALAEHASSMHSLLAHIRERGPVRSSDFERREGNGGGWWQWKDEKRWLESWFALGELMVARRERFQRVYDLAERVLARAGIDRRQELVRPINEDHLRTELILRSVRALGIARRVWIADYFRLRPSVAASELEPLLTAGLLVPVRVRGWDEPFYVHADHLAVVRTGAAGGLRATTSTLLSPFDPVVWDRQRAAELFGFDYRLECYTPAAKRRYGYFVLPFLHRGRLPARLDAKMHRDQRVFEIKGLWLEPGVRVDMALINGLASALRGTADWHGAERIEILATDPPSLRRPVLDVIERPRTRRRPTVRRG